jgi:predicted NBD/HSP70 family sugar kinase
VICGCGNVGCLEAIAGGAAVGRRAEAAARDGHSPLLAEALAARGTVNAEDVARAASHGDTLALGLITEAGQLVGGMLASLVNMLNPSLVVIGGGFAKSGEGLLAAVRHTVYGRSLPLATRDLLIQRSTLERVGGVIGAASMVMDELFTPVTLAVWLESGYPAARQLAHRAA